MAVFASNVSGMMSPCNNLTVSLDATDLEISGGKKQAENATETQRNQLNGIIPEQYSELSNARSPEQISNGRVCRAMSHG